NFLRPFVPRRHIVDRRGTVLAVDRPVYRLFAHPKLFKESKQAIAEKIAPILNRPVADLLKKFDERDSGVLLEYSLAESVVDRISSLQLDGLERLQYQQRLYPQQDLMASVVGYVNDDHKGQAGVELSQQNALERSVKAVRLSRMGDGSLMPDQVPRGFLNLDDLQLKLTLDSRLQGVATAAMGQQLKAFGAKRGAVIVMDVRDGSLLTLATSPSYDPNHYYKYPVELYKNWALTDLYEPGSTFKPINVAIALEAKTIKPDSVIDDEGQITIDGWTIGNFDGSGKGPISITDVLRYSSNVGMVRIAQTMKPDLYYDRLKRLGIGEVVHTDLPAAVAGQFKDRKTFTESTIEPATTSFGQGFSLTPIQLAQLHAAIANGGKLVQPHVVQGLFDSKGQTYWKANIAPPRQVFSPATTQAVLPMMESVVADGTGKPAQIPGYRIGGKTGTAQKANPNGGYYENAKITSFVSIFPIEAPRFVVVAVVDEPQGSDAFGATVAAPIVKTMMEALITTEKIPPNPAAPKPKLDSEEG
ncbi:penicillin-binding protein 2, partial [Leptolyngbya sp. FACHB-36]|uniref:peptidoglycan D,D-transpeptidase FtsI family protein n=1 Tax=Leptolyngbya sp. FACHB-36 TaxID=2692808 RepID=UPI001681655D